MYVSVREGYASIFKKEESEFVPGRNFLGGSATPYTGVPGAPGVRVGRATPINTWTDAAGNGAVIAIDPQTGQRKWTFKQFDVTDSGNLTTATDLLFTGGREGYFYALDARTGAELWRRALAVRSPTVPSPRRSTASSTCRLYQVIPSSHSRCATNSWPSISTLAAITGR
jgi:alcohol dehydrogenase (cytochrome c)